MKLHVRPSRISGSIAVPGSKSHTIRALGAALLAEGESRLYSPLDYADTRSVCGALRAFGAELDCSENCWSIRGTGGVFRNPGRVVDMGNSGTGLRILTSLAATQSFPISFDGDASLRTRGMQGSLAALSAMGVEVKSTNGKCPLTVCGPLSEKKDSAPIRVDGVGSQFLTSLLFACPLRKGISELYLDFLNEKSYVEITLGWLDFLGVSYEKSSDLLHFVIPGNQKFPAFERVIPADFSTAAFPLAAAALVGDGVTVRNLDFTDLQGDKRVFDFVETMGAEFSRGNELRILPARGRLHGGVFDLNETPDALPIMSVLGVLADGETRLVNAPQARLKETDRIAVMAEELSKMGARLEERPDGLILQASTLHGTEVHSHEDHRIAMSLAIAGLAAEGETVIVNAEALAVTYPNFIRDFQALGADFQIEE